MTAMPGHAAELEAKVAAQKAETVLAAVLPPWKRTETWERTGEMLGDLGQSNCFNLDETGTKKEVWETYYLH